MLRYVRHVYVAPYVGAWIETLLLIAIVASAIVAPYVGAWIETIGLDADEPIKMSHPTWVRGLKHQKSGTR